jgi:predicted NBD/HSP70 family sugar kinase
MTKDERFRRMKNSPYTLIGIDGGATKVSGWIINYEEQGRNYNLSGHHAESAYTQSESYRADFKPQAIPDQLSERESGKVQVSAEEQQQGSAYIDSTVKTIQVLSKLGGGKPVLIGIGMPGLKTHDMRGINVLNNGPRILDYCAQIEAKLNHANIDLLAPIARIGSDADYCGIGEFYSRNGSFRGLKNAYYLGGGTGAADALLLEGQLIPFDSIKPWMAKTWEMKNDKNISLERYASASGIQYIYSRHSHISVEKLNADQVFPPRIAELVIEGNEAAINTFQEISEYLSWLIFERISTLYCGSKEIFSFVNPKREALDPVHLYRGTILERIVIGQRLGELMAGKTGRQVLTIPILKKLYHIIQAADCFPENVREEYIKDTRFIMEKLFFSQLRESPALGAGIDAHRTFISNQ